MPILTPFSAVSESLTQLTPSHLSARRSEAQAAVCCSRSEQPTRALHPVTVALLRSHGLVACGLACSAAADLSHGDDIRTSSPSFANAVWKRLSAPDGCLQPELPGSASAHHAEYGQPELLVRATAACGDECHRPAHELPRFCLCPLSTKGPSGAAAAVTTPVRPAAAGLGGPTELSGGTPGRTARRGPSGLGLARFSSRTVTGTRSWGGVLTTAAESGGLLTRTPRRRRARPAPKAAA